MRGQKSVVEMHKMNLNHIPLSSDEMAEILCSQSTEMHFATTPIL